MKSHEFEADLDPRTGAPRIRFNFDNGWSVSIVLSMRPNATVCLLASVAACRTGHWSEGQTEIIENEAFADEVASILGEVASRSPLQ